MNASKKIYLTMAEFRFTGRKKTNLKASTETRTFSTQKNHEKKTNFFYPTHCKTITSLVSSLDCMSLPMMPLPLMLVDAIIRITIVDVFNFQKFSSRTLGFMGNCISKILAIAKFWQCVLRANKLNGRTKRKTEYFSFLKHPCHQILRKITSIDDDDNPVSAAETAATH